MQEKEVLLQTIGALNSTISSLSETNANLQKRIDELIAHDVNPRDYLNFIIAKMPYMQKASHEELLELLPHKWKGSNLSNIQSL